MIEKICKKMSIKKIIALNAYSNGTWICKTIYLEGYQLGYLKLHIYLLNVPTISKFPLRKENKFCDSIF